MSTPSWPEIGHAARKLEIHVGNEEDGWVEVRKHDSIHGLFQESEQGRQAAHEVIEQHRAVMERADAIRAMK